MVQRLRDRPATDLTLEKVLKKIDVYGRLAFGGQIVGVMAMLAGVALFITASIVPFFVWDDNRGEAMFYWLGGWATGIGLVANGLAFVLFCWRWSGDWITEWPGYAVCFAVALVALACVAYMMMSTPIPVYVSIAAGTVAAFLIGFAIAGHLAGTQVVEETRLQSRTPARRA